MSPFYWYEGIPAQEGWYLCAWEMGETYIYDVGRWQGGEWFTFAKGEPHLFHKIKNPHEFFEELDREAEQRQHDMRVNYQRQTQQEEGEGLPFLGLN